MFGNATEYLSECAPGLYRIILPLGSNTTKNFEGDYAHSSKQPDGGIVYSAIGGVSEVTIAIEVGLSQSYKSLCDAKDILILVCMDESPRFKNPTCAYDDIENVRTKMATMGQSVAEQIEWYTSHGYYGQIFYRGHRWTGEMSGARIEIWRPGCSSPDRYVSGCFRMDFLLVNHLTIRGLLPQSPRHAGAPNKRFVSR
ncbi:hypothetical protein V1515DRAFT_617014 [Lipomyces mesembrius]